MEIFLLVRTIAPVRVGAKGSLLSFPFFFFFVERVPFFSKFCQLLHSFTHNKLFLLFLLKLFYSRNITKKKTLSRPTRSFTTRCAWQWHWWCQWNWKIKYMCNNFFVLTISKNNRWWYRYCVEMYTSFSSENYYYQLTRGARADGEFAKKTYCVGKKLQHAEYVAQLQVFTSNSCLAHPPCECTPGKLEVVNSDLVGK